MHKSGLESEWSLLQNQFDSYEKYSLLIKLASIAVLSCAYLTNQLSIFVGVILAILWLQDGIWKTFQSRIETRLFEIEAYLSNLEAAPAIQGKAFQFNSRYAESRPSTVGLITEYCRQSIRPTVAYPHIFLLILLGYQLWC